MYRIKEVKQILQPQPSFSVIQIDRYKCNAGRRLPEKGDTSEECPLYPSVSEKVENNNQGYPLEVVVCAHQISQAHAACQAKEHDIRFIGILFDDDQYQKSEEQCKHDILGCEF